MIRISVLSENTVDRDELIPEDGLSLFIETSDHKIMMDAGGSDTAIHNAKIMGVPIYEADMAVLSHDHFDHGLGFISYYEEARRIGAKLPMLYLSEQMIYERHFADYGPGGLTAAGSGLSVQELERMQVPHRYIKGSVFYPFPEDKSICILPSIEKTCPFEQDTPFLKVLRDGSLSTDSFAHEMCLALTLEDGLLLMTGCAHNGIVNMITTAERLLGKPVIGVIGGTHLKGFDEERTDRTINWLNAKPELRMLAVCHCTGDKALRRFAESCPAYRCVHAGTVLEI